MPNHFAAALEKLSTTELSAVVAPLAGLLELSFGEPLDPQALRRFLDRYRVALDVHGHSIEWVAPNGERFDDSSEAEINGRAQALGEAPWKQLVFRVTGGEIGHPNQPFAALVEVRTGATTTLLQLANGGRAMLVWCRDVTERAHPSAGAAVEAFARTNADMVQVVAVAAGGTIADAWSLSRSLDPRLVPVMWEPTPSVADVLGVDTASSFVLVSADLQQATGPIEVFDEANRAMLIELVPSFASIRGPDQP